MKLFSKRNIYLIRMVLEELIAHHLRVNLNLFPTKVRASPNQFSIKIHSRTTTLTRTNKRVIIQAVKNFSKLSIASLHHMTFCRNFTLTPYFRLWLKIIRNRHWTSNPVTHRIISSYKWSLVSRVWACKILNSARANRRFRYQAK